MIHVRYLCFNLKRVHYSTSHYTAFRTTSTIENVAASSGEVSRMFLCFISFKLKIIHHAHSPIDVPRIANDDLIPRQDNSNMMNDGNDGTTFADIADIMNGAMGKNAAAAAATENDSNMMDVSPSSSMFLFINNLI